MKLRTPESTAFMTLRHPRDGAAMTPKTRARLLSS
jgi:hypothetical protein